MIGFVLARIVLSVSGNTVQKRLVVNGAEVRMLWLVTYALMLLPAGLLALLRPTVPSASFWGDICLGGFLDAIGNLAMVAALRATDLSVFGPLNAFRPVLALLFGWVFLAEMPTLSGGLGVAVTVGGSFLLLTKDSGPHSKPPPERLREILGLRFLGLALSTFGAVFLKRAASNTTAELTLFGWIACGLVCLVLTAWWRKETGLWSLSIGFRKHWAWLLVHAGLFLLMQWFTIRIFQQTLLAYSFVFFQLGMILQVVMGKVVFREPHFRRRLVGCLIMGAGSALILWKG